MTHRDSPYSSHFTMSFLVFSLFARVFSQILSKLATWPCSFYSGSRLVNLLPLDSPGPAEGVRPHQVPGAPESKGPRLRHPSEGPHRLGAHDRRALLHRAGLPAPEGHMVSTGPCHVLTSSARHQLPSISWRCPVLRSSRPAPSFEFNFTCSKRAESSPVQANILLQVIISKKDNCESNDFNFVPPEQRFFGSTSSILLFKCVRGVEDWLELSMCPD